MKKDFDPRRLDIRRFAQDAGELESAEPLKSYSRLIDETDGRGPDNPVTWSAQGEMLNAQHVQPEIWLHLKADTRLPLVCQRCLHPVDVDVGVNRSFRFVHDESTAAAQDDEADEDVLAESRSFDLLQLIEDELLMAMPLVPRHEVCPESLPTAAGEKEFEEAQAQKESPFATLGRLKRPQH